MKSAGTQSISMALRSIVVAVFGLVFMFITSPILTALTLAILPVTLLAFRACASSLCIGPKTVHPLRAFPIMLNGNNRLCKSQFS